MRTRMRWAAFALMTPLLGCGGGVNIISTVSYNGYDPSYVSHAAADGPLPVRVFGQPASGVDADATAAQIGEAMAGSNIGQQFDYSVYTTPPENGYVLVVRFGDGTPASRLCQADVASGVGLNFGMAFCKKGHALSYLSGVAASADIASATFRNGMEIAAIEMFPPENPELDCDINDDCD